MTLVEFYSENQIENIISALSLNPSKIIFVGYENSISEDNKKVLRKYFSMKKIKAPVKFVNIKKHSFKCAADALTNICEKNPDCTFDFTGGEELILAAMGFVMAKYNVCAIESDAFKSILYTDLQKGLKSKKVAIKNSVYENFYMNGGVIDRTKQKSEKGIVMPDKFNEVYKLWDICKTDNLLWNSTCGVFKSIKDNKYPKDSENDIFKKLVEGGFVIIEGESDKAYIIKYKDNLIEICLEDPGVILEFYTYCALKESDLFNDVRVGVTVDWDGIIHGHKEKSEDTSNELDVVATKGIRPVYISCKNGKVTKEALYELNTVSSRFGDKYAEKILIAPALYEKNVSDEYLINRAEDMGITIITNVSHISKEDYIKQIIEVTEKLNIKPDVVS